MVDRVDAFQRRHPVLGFPIAVFYKYFDDQGPFQAATLTYYAFAAIFPLMLLGTSILGLVLRGQPDLQEVLLDSALSQFPIIGDELGHPAGLQGSVTGITVGSLAALYGTLGLGQSLQNLQHLAWGVPRNSRPNPILSRVKTVGLLIVAGTALLAVSVLSALISNTDVFVRLGSRDRWLVSAITVLVVGTFLTLLFRFAATGRHPTMRSSAPGAFTLAVLWQFLQILGTEYVNKVLVNTSSMTKTFGLVLGLLGFIYIGAMMAALATEVNVVLTLRLYPRALLTPFTDHIVPTDADRRAYTMYARMQRHKDFETIRVTWGESPKEIAVAAAAAERAEQAARERETEAERAARQRQAAVPTQPMQVDRSEHSRSGRDVPE